MSRKQTNIIRLAIVPMWIVAMALLSISVVVLVFPDLIVSGLSTRMVVNLSSAFPDSELFHSELANRGAAGDCLAAKQATILSLQDIIDKPLASEKIDLQKSLSWIGYVTEFHEHDDCATTRMIAERIDSLIIHLAIIATEHEDDMTAAFAISLLERIDCAHPSIVPIAGEILADGTSAPTNERHRQTAAFSLLSSIGSNFNINIGVLQEAYNLLASDPSCREPRTVQERSELLRFMYSPELAKDIFARRVDGCCHEINLMWRELEILYGRLLGNG